jgi:hypothetical protein
VSEQNPFSPEALRKSIESLPPEQGGIGAVADGSDVGIAGSVSKRIGKGWSLQATGQWMKDAGYRAAVWVGWKGSQT